MAEDGVQFSMPIEFYETHLRTINNVKFRRREIDIVAFMINGRSGKKTASFLSLSPKTIENYTHNIMLRLEYNSREAIIDFIEKSDQLKNIRKYYSILLAQDYFESKLKQIDVALSKEKRVSVALYYQQSQKHKFLLEEIQRHLKILGINVFLEALEKHQSFSEVVSINVDRDYLIYAIPSISDAAAISPTLNQISQGDTSEGSGQQTKGIFFLFLEGNFCDELPTQETSADYLRLLDYKNYCLFLFAIIKRLLPELDLKTTIEDFNKKTLALFDLSIPIDDKDDQNLNDNNKGIFFLFMDSILKKKILSIFSVGVFFIIIFFVVGSTNFTKLFTTHDDNFEKNTSIAEVPTAVKAFEEFMKAIKDQQFSADNTHPDKIKKNHSLIKKIEKLLDHSKLKEVQEYLTRAEMPAEILMQYLYHLQALASYYMYNMQNGEKPQQILLYAKDLAEKYVNIRGSVNNDFNDLKNDEIFVELNIVKDLPQMYTRIIYSLARTYIYKKNAIEGKRYFELAEYLGNKLGLFEGYMSKINGLLVIEDKVADSYLKEDNIGQAAKILHHIVRSFLTLSGDSQSYVTDYNPGATEQKTIVPKENLYNLSICATRVISAYSKLIQITNNAREIQHYIGEINKYLQIYEKTGGGLLKILNQLPGEKQANLCNKLGNLVLILWECKNIKSLVVDNIQLKQTIIKAFFKDKIYDENINLMYDDLALTEKLFFFSKEQSRSTEYTKADSYKGLISTYEKMLNHTHGLLENQRQDLKVKINDLLNKLKTISLLKNKENNI